MAETGYEDFMRSDQEVVFGHEFSGRVVEHGPGCRKSSPTDTPVVALPLLRRGAMSTRSASRPRRQARTRSSWWSRSRSRCRFPNGLAPELAALDRADGGRLARRPARARSRRAASRIVHRLRADRAGRDLHAQGERRAPCGGERLLLPGAARSRAPPAPMWWSTPRTTSPYADGGEHGHLESVPAAFDLAVGAMERLRRLPGPWWQVWRAAEALGAKPNAPVVFECVGSARCDRRDHRRRAVLLRGWS